MVYGANAWKSNARDRRSYETKGATDVPLSKEARDLIAAETRASEAAEAEQSSPIPPHVRVTRGKPRSKVLQVRLNPEELDALERIADRRELPVSTIAREQLLKLVAQDGLADSDRLHLLYDAADLVKSLADTMRADNGRDAETTRH